MPYTDFPDGVTSFGVPLPNGGLPLFNGNIYFVDYANGSDGNTGEAQNPFKTIARAYSKMVDGNNDVCVIVGDGSTTATQRISSTLTWAKDACHLIGMTAPVPIAARARISHASTAPTTAFTPMVLVTAQGCVFANLSIFEGFAQTGTAVVTWEDQGSRNLYSRVQFGGMGNLTANTSFHQAGSASLLLTGGGEHYFDTCAIGLDTAPRDAANASLRLRSQSARNWFNNCEFPMYATATSPFFVDTNAANSLNRWLKFRDCDFYNVQGITSSASLVAGFSVSATQNGDIRLMGCSWYGMDDLVAADTARLILNMPAASDDAGGQMVAWDQTP